MSDDIELPGNIETVAGAWPIIALAAFLVGAALVVAAAVVMARLEDRNE